MGVARLRILYVEPFDAGSHARFTRDLVDGLAADWTVLTLPGRHWKWRMRGAALALAESAADALARPHDLVFASSFTPLADLTALVPALAQVPKIVYFHENQWAYPVRDERERDHHYGITQLVSARVADLCLFNSQWNRDSFLRGSRAFLARMPDARPTALVDAIARKSEVLPVPLEPAAFPVLDLPPGAARTAGPHVLWNHRWEHDKAPEDFFAVLEGLAARDVPFRVIVCGESFREVPPVFATARSRLGARIVHFGHARDRQQYRSLLASAQIAVSTARHEFFGVAMLEAARAGATPMVPDRLAYPELFAAADRYRDRAELEARLEAACRSWTAGAIDLRIARPEPSRAFDAARVLRALDARLRAVHAGRHISAKRS